MAYDMSVAATAYATAKSLGASNKIMLALFEAMIVESGVRNLDYGDRDSLGVLQQRPSQGWPNPRHVPTAVKSFVNKAKKLEHKSSTAGQLAQAVQVSAFPLRYDQRKGEAEKLIAKVSGGAYIADTGLAGGGIEHLSQLFDNLTDPSTWRRVAYFGGGIILLIIAILVFTGRPLVKAATKVLPVGKVAKAVKGVKK